MANTPNPNIINESDFFASLDAGEIQEVNKPPLVAGAPEAPPSLPPQTIPTLQGSLPLGMQFPTDLIKTQMPGVPSQRLWPVAPAGVAGTNSAVTSGTRGISNTANQANKTAASANTTAKGASAAVTVVSSTPVMQVDSGGTVTQAPISGLGSGGGSRTPTTDNLVDGTLFVRLAATHAAGNVSYNFKGAWSSATSYVIADEVTSDNIYWIALASSLNSQPAIGNANWQAVGRIQGDIQIFTSSGVWSKPASGSLAIITVIGGGGGGASGLDGNTGAPSAGGTGGGAGNFGGFSTQILPLSVLGSTETVTVGTGGASDANGLTSSFGGWLQATGGISAGIAGKGTVAAGGISMFPGAGGTGNNGGGISGGGGTSSGSNGAAGSSGATGRPTPYGGGTAGTGGAGGVTGTNGNSGGNGTAASTDEPAGGGGGGGAGGGGSSSTGVAGNGGTGGNGGKYGSGGGGGGGGGASDTGTPGNGGAGGSGAPGIVIVVTY